MSLESKKKFTWIQCQTCGEIYQIPCTVPIDQIFIAVNCPECGVTTGLNLGCDEDDIYLYMNTNTDLRYYNY